MAQAQSHNEFFTGWHMAPPFLLFDRAVLLFACGFVWRENGVQTSFARLLILFVNPDSVDFIPVRCQAIRVIPASPMRKKPIVET